MKGKKIVIPAIVLSLVGGAGILATLNQSSAPVSNTSKTTTKVSSTDKSSLAKNKESRSTEQSSATSTKDSNQSSTSTTSSQSESSVAGAESSQTEPSSQQVATESKVGAEKGATELSKENSQETIDKLRNSQSQAGQKVMLNVRPQIQRAWNTCAPTTVSMMLSYRGIEVSQEVLAQEMGTDNTFGTHNANAIQILNRHLFGYDHPQSNQAGYRLATVTTSDVHSEQMSLFKQRLRQNIADGYPMYYTFDSSKIYPGLRGEHNVIGIGYQLSEDGSDIAYLYYLDPSPNAQDPVYGGLKKVSPQELFASMLTCVEPNYGW
ncbi:TPA: C39 family peptidase [Streptococcus suis]|nr:C39 family peptidase [Streptococcus suis]